MKRLALTLTAAFALTAAFGGSASAQPGFCEDTMEPMMEQYQFFSEDVQQHIDAVSPCKD